MDEADEDIVMKLARLLVRLDAKERRRCPNCGNVPPKRANYCDECGRQLVKAEEGKPRVKVKKIHY